VRARKTIRSRLSDNANHFPLKLPFAPGQSSVSKAIYPAGRRAIRIPTYANSTDRQKKAPDSLRFSAEVNSGREA